MKKKCAKLVKVVCLVLLSISVFGCSTTPYHADLMNNNQLIGASCDELNIEEKKVGENAKNTDEASSLGEVGTIFIGMLEAFASQQTKTPIDVQNSATMNMAAMTDENTKQASALKTRKDLISTLRLKKKCQ